MVKESCNLTIKANTDLTTYLLSKKGIVTVGFIATYMDKNIIYDNKVMFEGEFCVPYLFLFDMSSERS